MLMALVDFHFDGVSLSHKHKKWKRIAEKLVGRRIQACTSRYPRIEIK
jgi:hypothetical protein